MLLVRHHRARGLSAAHGQPLRINGRDLVMQAVAGEITNPVGRTNPYRIGTDGVVRILPGPGGIVLNRRIGDRCVGLAVDHVEPGVSLRNHQHGAGVAAADGPNLALMTSALRRQRRARGHRTLSRVQRNRHRQARRCESRAGRLR